MTTLNQLLAEREELRNQKMTPNNVDAILEKLKHIDAQIQIARTAEVLKNVNAKQERLRELAKRVWECEQPTEDITCNDGSLHKVKVKKYPIIAGTPYLRLLFTGTVNTEMILDGERFTMVRTKYESGKPNVYARPDTFADFLELNTIQAEEISSEQFATFSYSLDEANEELRKAIKKYEQKRKELNTWQMEQIGLVSRNDEHLYIYNARKY